MAKKKSTKADAPKKKQNFPQIVLLLAAIYLTFVLTYKVTRDYEYSKYEDLVSDRSDIIHTQADEMTKMEKTILKQDKDLSAAGTLAVHASSELAICSNSELGLKKQIANLKNERDRALTGIDHLQCALQNAITNTKHLCDTGD